MSTFPWTTLITAGAPVVASLGTVWLKGLFDDHAQARQAEQASVAAASERQRNAYIGLMEFARFWLSAAREIRAEFEGLPKDNALDRSRILVQDLTKAVGLVELVGSTQARGDARKIYETAMSVGEMYARRVSQPAAARKDPTTPAAEFDHAKKNLDDLDKAISRFADNVWTELGEAPPTSAGLVGDTPVKPVSTSV